MNEELIKELSRLQLLWSRYKNKLSMCPLEIKKEEIRAYIIYEHIKDLKQQLKQRGEVIDEVRQILNKHKFEKNDDYYDYSEKGICITDWDDDYDKLNALLQKGKENDK